MFLIVGLGNPGKAYEKTKHNLGFQVIDCLALRPALPVTKMAHHALIGEGELCGQKIILAKPQTYMNESGKAVQALLSWYKILPHQLLVICDDLDLEPGQLRLRRKGSSAGHNGLESIIQAIGTSAFPRLRIGVGKVHKSLTVKHVLSSVKRQEKKLFQNAVEQGADAIETILTHGFDTAMNHFN